MKWKIPNTYYVLEIPKSGQPKVWSHSRRFQSFFGGRGILKPALEPHGYLFVQLRVSQEGKMISKMSRLHRLVAEAIYGPCPEGSEVNHIDGDKLNNRPENLEYVTHSENMEHATSRDQSIARFFRSEGRSYEIL